MRREKLRPVLLPENWEARRKRTRVLLLVTVPSITLMLFFFGIWLGHLLWPKLPKSLTPIEAAHILRTENGFAGYSLINSNGGPDGVLRHEIFCQNCGTPIADVNVTFIQQKQPTPGSRLALLLDTVRLTANAVAAQQKPKRAATPIKKVEALN